MVKSSRAKRYQIIFYTLSLAALCFGVTSCEVEANVQNVSPPEAASSGDWRAQVSQLDKDIAAKTNQMNLLRAQAARYKNQGDRLQFSSRDVTEARRYWNQADESNAQADLLAMQVSQLKAKRSDILNRNHVSADDPTCPQPPLENDSPDKPS